MSNPPAADASRRRRIAVVGGGITGLAAAHRIHSLRPDVEICVLERGLRVGGALDTLRHHGWILERGADSFTTKLPNAVELCHELGLGDQLVGTNPVHRRALVVRDGRLLPAPEGFVLMRANKIGGVLRSTVLSTRGKLRLLAEPWINAPAEVHQEGYDESVESFAVRRLGRESYERLVEPLLAGIYVADATRLSLAGTMPEFLAAERIHGSLTRALWRAPRLREAESSQQREENSSSGARYSVFVSLRNGLSELVRTLCAALPAGSVATSVEVQQISRTRDGRWRLRVGRREGARDEVFDAIVVAAQAPAAGALLADVDAELSDLLSRIRYASSAVVGLACRRAEVAHPLDGFGFVSPAIENRDIVAGSFASVKYPGRVPDEIVHLRAFVGGALRPEFVDRSDADLVDVTRREFGELIGLHGEPLWSDVARWRQSMPQYDVGHVQLVDEIFQCTCRWPRLALAGNAYRGVGIPQCIASGRLAAEAIVEQID